MTQFLLRRLVLSLPVLLGILVVTFTLGRLIPGDPCIAQLGERATDEICDGFNQRYGLDQPIPLQFGYYIVNVLQGDLGLSLSFQVPVTQLLAERLPTTIELTLAAIIFATIVGIPLGILSAYKHNTSIDVITMIISNIGVSMPVFWLGIILIIIFSVWMPRVELFGTPIGETPLGFLVLPSGRPPSVRFDDRFYAVYGLVTDTSQIKPWMEFVARFTLLNALITFNWPLFIEAMRHLVLPAVAVGTIPLSIIARMTRSSLLESLNQDYVRTARAKGLRESSVVIGHAVRNAMLPVVTIIGLNFGFLISGAVLTETIFRLTGIGKTLFDGITARDYTVVQGVTLVTAVAFVFINLIVDILYGYLDPRVRLE
ncbi:MAG: ABC transporter permease [Anaerolineae bacterium]